MPNSITRGSWILFCAGLLAASQVPAQVVPEPAWSGPLPVTDSSHPLNAAAYNQLPMDLAELGYVEEEFLVSGSAQVYDWAADGSLSVLATGQPYTTRILVRRPADPAQFSGTAIVETFNNARDYDWAFIWPLSFEHFVEQGHAWIGVTHTAAALESLRRFDPPRYAAVGFAPARPGPACEPTPAALLGEEGLRYDLMSQVAALLKSTAGPLGASPARFVYGTTHTREFMTYANTIHKTARLADGTTPYDGFVIKTEYAPVDRIRTCVAAPAEGDSRRIVRNAGVPVMRVTAEGDALETLGVRREDSDAAGDAYRLWEVAGAPHMDRIFYQHMPVLADQVATGQPGYIANWPMAYACTPDIDLLDFLVMRYTMNAAFAAMRGWVERGVPAPRAPWLQLAETAGADPVFATDAYGNALGGVRSVYLDVPIARYQVHSPGTAVCNNLGRREPFAWSMLETLYGTADAYAERVEAALESLVTSGWLTTEDSLRLRRELLGD